MPTNTTKNPAISTHDKAEDITLAVELKFLILQDLDTLDYPVRPFVPHRPEHLRNSMTQSETQLWKDNWAAVAQAMNALPGVDALTSHQIQEQGLGHTDYWKTHWIVYKANSAVPPYLTYHLGDPDHPVLDEMAPEYSKQAWTPVEICSPLLYWTQKDEALSTLKRILSTINKKFGTIVNHSTETHTHLGRVDGKFYSLNTMKKIATLLWLSEPILRGLKDPRSPNFDHAYTWSYPIRRCSRIALAQEGQLPGGQTVDDLYTGRSDDLHRFLAKLDDARGTAATGAAQHNGCTFSAENRQALTAIWRAIDHQELGRMLSGPERKYRRLGFNFHSLGQEDDRARESPRTVEVRFLEGFVDDTVVPAWVRLCGELVELATEEQGDDYEFYGVVALLLGLPVGWSLDAKFSAFMNKMGRRRIPVSVYEPLQAIIRRNYPPGEMNME